MHLAAICQAKYVLDVDIEKCFARIYYLESLFKIHTSRTPLSTPKGIAEGKRSDHGK